MTTEDGQLTMTEGADILLAGKDGVVLGGRVAEVAGGRVIIDLDGAGQPEVPTAEEEDYTAAEYSAAERLAMIGWIAMAPGLYAAAGLVRDAPVLAVRAVTAGPGWIAGRLLKAAHADWGPSDAIEGR